MSKKEINKEIENKINESIRKRGLSKQLKFDPIPNTFKRRPHYYKKTDGTAVFTAFLWQLNCLSGEALDKEIENRTQNAITYFNL